MTNLGAAPLVAWVDYQQRVHIGSLQTHKEQIVAPGGGDPTTPLIVSGDKLFWVGRNPMGPEVMAYDATSGHVRSFASGTAVFNAVRSTDVFVDDGNLTTIAKYRVDGSLVKRFELPRGWYVADSDLEHPGPALAGGTILVTSRTSVATQPQGSNPPKLGVWKLATGKVQPLGNFSFLIATYSDARGAGSLLAWLPTCGTAGGCPLQLTNLTTGLTRQIGNPLGFGFDFGGAFSPDGRQLAVFAKTNSGFSDPATELALVDVRSGSLRLVPGAAISIGEAVAWAQWLPDRGKLAVGGLSGSDGRGQWQANHYLVDSGTLRSMPFSFIADGEQDVNYSAVVLP